MSVLSWFHKLLHIWKIFLQILFIWSCWRLLKNWNFTVWISSRGQNRIFMGNFFWSIRKFSNLGSDRIFSFGFYPLRLLWIFDRLYLCLLLLFLIRNSFRVLFFFLFLLLCHNFLVSFKKLFVNNLNVFKFITWDFLNVRCPFF